MSVCLCSQLNVPQCWCYTTNLRFPCHTCTNTHKHTNPCPNSQLTTAPALPAFSPWKAVNGSLGRTVLPVTSFMSDQYLLFSSLSCDDNTSASLIIQWDMLKRSKMSFCKFITQRFDVATLQHKIMFVKKLFLSVMKIWWFHLKVVKWELLIILPFTVESV